MWKILSPERAFFGVISFQMNTITHALLPVILAHVALPEEKRFKRWSLVAIGFAGAMPDLLTPHMSLESRLMSWSHALPFWAALTVAVYFIPLFAKNRFSNKLALALSLAYLLHIFCDAISGGVNFLHPVANFIWGRYWVSPLFWIPLDFICMMMVYYLFRFRPLWERRKQALIKLT